MYILKPAPTVRVHAFSRKYHALPSALQSHQLSQKPKSAILTVILPYAKFNAEAQRAFYFSLVSDATFQIDARFIGFRPEGRPRDYTWIQALGILFDSHKFSIEATPSAIWDEEVDHLKLSYDGEELVIREGHLSTWKCKENQLRVARTSSKNNIMVTLPEVVEIYVNVVPVTKEDSRTHNYQIPDNDCLSHLEVQFKFYGLTSKVEGVLGRTYQPDFQNATKPGVAMPVVGGEDKYRTTSLVSADGGFCTFSPAKGLNKKNSVMEYGMMDSTSSANSGNGIRYQLYSFFISNELVYCNLQEQLLELNSYLPYIYINQDTSQISQ
ncbi:hypothetical protein VNO78_13670 [Psophocarpus tetragonolobus]|uniref:Uncharacterized protein n=1 Tax=Psophocarpus tetragonolobus TaxID=3891 RepID=A0AAN9SRF0_PSOTE